MYLNRSFYLSVCQFTLRLRSRLFGRLVGGDVYGNFYYTSKRKDWAGRQQRWVLYGGEAEATMVPPAWFGWLHHMCDAPLPSTIASGYQWARPYVPNLSGTQAAYLPAGHALSRLSARLTATPRADFHAWRPSD